MTYVDLVVEDYVQYYIGERVLATMSDSFQVNRSFGFRGNGYIKKNIRGFNEASKFQPYIVFTDLDHLTCPLELVNEWIDFPLNDGIIFQIAVREAEAWLLADRSNFSKFFGVSEDRIPRNSAEINDPKDLITQLANNSRLKNIRESFIPPYDASVGPNYNEGLCEFILEYWDVDVASSNSSSLNRLIKKLERF